MGRKATRWILPLAAVATLTLGGVDARHAPMVTISVARADPTPAWKQEFEDICAKTQDAMVLSPDELRSLVARCDKLLPDIEKLEPSERKVFTRRLQACRNLYQFMLDSK